MILLTRNRVRLNKLLDSECSPPRSINSSKVCSRFCAESGLAVHSLDPLLPIHTISLLPRDPSFPTERPFLHLHLLPAGKTTRVWPDSPSKPLQCPEIKPYASIVSLRQASFLKNALSSVADKTSRHPNLSAFLVAT